MPPLNRLTRMLVAIATLSFLVIVLAYLLAPADRAGRTLVAAVLIGAAVASIGVRFTYSLPSSSEIVDGMIARIHRFPSSSFGRNSRPSERSATVAAANSTSMTRRTRILLRTANLSAGM